MMQIENKTAKEMIKNLRPIDGFVADSGDAYGFVKQYAIAKDKYILEIGNPKGFEYVKTNKRYHYIALGKLLLNPDLSGWDAILNKYEILGYGKEVGPYGKCENYRIMKHQYVYNNGTLHSWCDDENGNIMLFQLDEACDTIAGYQDSASHLDCVLYTIHCL